MQVLANHSARKLVCMYVLSPNTGGLQSKWFHLLVTEENKCAGNKPFGLTSLVRVWRTARHYLRANGEHGEMAPGGGGPSHYSCPRLVGTLSATVERWTGLPDTKKTVSARHPTTVLATYSLRRCCMDSPSIVFYRRRRLSPSSLGNCRYVREERKRRGKKK